MAYSDIIDRAGVAGDIPREFSEAILGDLEQQSTIMALAKRVPVSGRDSRVPVLATVPDARWVSGEVGLKHVDKATFDSQPLVVEEIATIVVVPDATASDSTWPIWDALRPLVARSFARRIDRTILFGEEKPASFPTGMVPAAIAAGNTVTASDDPVVDVLNAARVVAEAERNPDAAAVSQGWEFRAAATRSDAFSASPVGAGAPFPLSIAGLGIRPRPVYWDPAVADVVVAEWDSILVGVRQDITFEFSNSAVITDENGVVQSNMWQQDSTSMRCVMRLAYTMLKPATASGSRGVPVAVVTPA
jgi:hypothetical protein